MKNALGTAIKYINRTIFLLILSSLTLTGCGSNLHLPSGSSNIKPAATSVAADSTEDSESKETRMIKGYLLGTSLPGFKDVMDELNNKLTKDLNVRMQISFINWSEVQSKYPLILASGEGVDFVFTGSWVFYSTLASKGAFLEITPEMLKKYMPRHNARIRGTTAFQETTINGRSYMITTSTPDRKVPVFIYREDLRKKYGLPEIKRFSDIEPYMKAVKENEHGMIPLDIGSNYDLSQPFTFLLTEKYDLLQDLMVSTAGGSGIFYKPFDTDGKLYYITRDPLLSEFKKEAVTMKSWYDKGYICKNAFANRVRSKEAFVQGKSAIGLGNSIDIQSNISQSLDEGYEVGLLPVVSGKSGHAIKDPYIINGFSIAATSKNAIKTLQAMDLIMEDESYDNLVYFGIKGKNYTIKGGKTVLLNDKVTHKNSYPPDQAGFWFTNKDLLKPLASWPDSYTNLRNQLDKLLAPNIYSAFSPSLDEVKTETDNCNQVITQYLTPIQLGAFKDVNTSFDTLDKKLKAANIERVMDVMEAQAKEYLREHRN